MIQNTLNRALSSIVIDIDSILIQYGAAEDHQSRVEY